MLTWMHRAIPMCLGPPFDGMLESSDEETRSDSEHHETICGLHSTHRSGGRNLFKLT
jgi:hypothetical protein